MPCSVNIMEASAYMLFLFMSGLFSLCLGSDRKTLEVWRFLYSKWNQTDSCGIHHFCRWHWIWMQRRCCNECRGIKLASKCPSWTGGIHPTGWLAVFITHYVCPPFPKASMLRCYCREQWRRTLRERRLWGVVFICILFQCADTVRGLNGRSGSSTLNQIMFICL